MCIRDSFTTVPDPDLMLQKAGIQRQHLRFLELDDEVAQCVETRKDAVIGTPWRLEPVSYTHLDVYKRQPQGSRSS